MQQPISNFTIIALDQFPMYQVPSSKSDLTTSITKYLRTLLNSKLTKGENNLELPSFSLLAVFFKCSCLEIYDAFKALRSQGYDYHFSSLDAGVLVWRTNDHSSR